MTSPSPTVADPPVEAAAPATEPAAAPATDAPDISTMAAAFRSAGPEALKERSAARSRRAATAASEEPAAGDPAASKPDASAAASQTEGEPSRRGAAAAIKERDAEIERLAAERIAEKQRADEHASKLKTVTDQQEAARKVVLERIGSDTEFERLQGQRLRREPMSYEDDEKLDAMLAWREHAGTLWELTDRAHRAGVAKGLGSLVEQLGLDQQTAFGADLPGLVAHVAERTEARVRAETADELAALKKSHAEAMAEVKAELKGYRTRAGATAPPVVGGASAPVGDLPADGASPTSFFAAGIRNRPPQRAGGAASRRAS